MTKANFDFLIDNLKSFKPFKKMKLLWSPKLHGDTVVEFFKRVENKTNVVAVFKDKATGHVGGGYRSVAVVKGDLIYRRDPEAFLFSLTEKVKMGLKKGWENKAV